MITKRRFTKTNVLEIFRQWPQAVSADEGDLRVLHDMANAGAQLWRQSLRWPDYLWLDLQNGLADATTAETRKEIYNVADPTGTGPHTSFSAIKQSVDKSQLPPSGSFPITNRVMCMLELKVIDADLVPKLSAYKPDMPWADFLRMKFDQWIGDRLRDADKQIAGGKRLLPFHDARGVAVIVNERSANLPSDIVLAHLTHAIHRFPNLDGILYLSDVGAKPFTPAFVFKAVKDPLLKRFSIQASMMFAAFNYEAELPVNRSGPQPELVARIEMDERSRAMYRTWATGWRRADDQTPVPSPSMTISFVLKERFVSGLPRTAADSSLLDCRLRWDPDGTNLRLDNG